jgi:hypothetical protein
LKKALIITVAAVALIALAATGALFALNAGGSSYQTCGKVTPSQLTKPADPEFAKKLEKLARCER